MRDQILATIAYHDVLGLPLTRFEIEWYLMRVPSSLGHSERSEESQGKLREESRDPRLSGGQASVAPLTASLPQDDRMSDIGAALEALRREQKLYCLNGFWCLPGREHLAAERIEKHKLAETKWKIVQRWGRLLAFVPFVRAVFVSGSLVFHNAHLNSDLDVLIIAKYGRIWTTRVLATGLVGLFGRRRHGDKIQDRMCFNHFLTDQSLRMPYPSLYNAVTYSRLIPLFELGVTQAQFLAANPWIETYVRAAPRVRLGSWKTLSRPMGSRAVQRALEWLLGGRRGDWLEQRFKAIQKQRIEADPRSFEPGGRVMADDTQLEFHPASPEIGVLAAYRERLKALGLERPVSHA